MKNNELERNNLEENERKREEKYAVYAMPIMNVGTDYFEEEDMDEYLYDPLDAVFSEENGYFDVPIIDGVPQKPDNMDVDEETFQRIISQEYFKVKGNYTAREKKMLEDIYSECAYLHLGFSTTLLLNCSDEDIKDSFLRDVEHTLNDIKKSGFYKIEKKVSDKRFITVIKKCIRLYSEMQMIFKDDYLSLEDQCTIATRLFESYDITFG